MKEVLFNNIRLELYSIKELATALNKSACTLKRLEKYGTLAPAFFGKKKDGKLVKRFYCQYEIQVIFWLKLKFGSPKKIYSDSLFLKELNKMWNYIREELKKGNIPDIPIILRFENMIAFRNVLRQTMSIYGIVSSQILAKMEETFLEYQIRRA